MRQARVRLRAGLQLGDQTDVLRRQPSNGRRPSTDDDQRAAFAKRDSRSTTWPSGHGKRVRALQRQAAPASNATTANAEQSRPEISELPLAKWFRLLKRQEKRFITGSTPTGGETRVTPERSGVVMTITSPLATVHPYRKSTGHSAGTPSSTACLGCSDKHSLQRQHAGANQLSTFRRMSETKGIKRLLTFAIQCWTTKSERNIDDLHIGELQDFLIRAFRGVRPYLRRVQVHPR